MFFLVDQLDQYSIKNDARRGIEPADLDERKSTEMPRKNIFAMPSGRAFSTPQSTFARVEERSDTNTRAPESHSSSDPIRRESVDVDAIQTTLSR